MRLYNGAPDSALQAKMDADDAARKELAELGVHPTYFPAEQAWMGFRGHRACTGFHSSIPAMARALRADLNTKP